MKVLPRGEGYGNGFVTGNGFENGYGGGYGRLGYGYGYGYGNGSGYGYGHGYRFVGDGDGHGFRIYPYTLLLQVNEYKKYNNLGEVHMNRGGFSWKRFLGITRVKQNISRRIGIPLSRSGRQRKVGGFVINLIKRILFG